MFHPPSLPYKPESHRVFENSLGTYWSMELLLIILLIVVIVLAITGGVGYSRRGGL
jgi:hypothetical protein